MNPTPTYLSYSQISTYRTCGEQYRLRYVAGVPRQPNVAAFGGTATHAAADVVDRRILEGDRDPQALFDAAISEAESVLSKSVDSAIRKNPEFADERTWKTYGRYTKEWPLAQSVAWYRKLALPAGVMNYINWRTATPDLVPMDIPGFGPAIEVPFIVYLGDTPVRGYIDRVFESVMTGSRVVVDIKHGAKPQTDEQLGLYAKALRSSLPGEFRWGAYLYGLKYSDKPGKLTEPLDLHHWTDEKLAAVYLESQRGIKAELYIPHPGDACFHCAVAGSCTYNQSAL